jgi:hypothetical protein
MTQCQKQQVEELLTDSSLGHFGLAMATPDISHASTFCGCRPSSNKNHSGIDIGHYVKENTPSPHNVVNACGIADLHPADCSRMREPTVTHQGIFGNAFADEWTTSEPDPLTHSAIIDHIIQICDFPIDSIMVKYIGQKQWSMLAHVVYVGLDEVDDFFTVRKDGLHLKIHQCLFTSRNSRHSCCTTRAKLAGVMVQLKMMRCCGLQNISASIVVQRRIMMIMLRPALPST